MVTSALVNGCSRAVCFWKVDTAGGWIVGVTNQLFNGEPAMPYHQLTLGGVKSPFITQRGQMRFPVLVRSDSNCPAAESFAVDDQSRTGSQQQSTGFQAVAAREHSVVGASAL